MSQSYQPPEGSYPYPQPPQAPQQSHTRRNFLVGCGTLLLVVICIAVIIGVATSGNKASTNTAKTPTPKATATPAVVHYPPTTVADLHGLAAKGDASAIHEFHSESVGLAQCPQPKREVTVAASITGQQLAEDLLAYFYANHLDTANCGALVLAYHSQSEAGNAYTAGSINVDTQNTDPNNSTAKRTLTIYLGAADDPNLQAYSVTYA